MKLVTRQEIDDYQTYTERRDDIKKRVFEIKRPRRIHVGTELTFLFENTETVRYQIQEMMRIEQIVKESDILHEIKTYNELIGQNGQLGGTLLVEISDEEERRTKLTRWLGLMDHIYMKFSDGSSETPSFDPRQVGETQLSSVQYFKFDVGKRTPVALGANHPELVIEAPLSEEQRLALTSDLAL